MWLKSHVSDNLYRPLQASQYQRSQHRKLSFSSSPALIKNATTGKFHELSLLQPLKSDYGEYSLALSMDEAKRCSLAYPLRTRYPAHRTQTLVSPGESAVADISIASPKISMQKLSGWGTSQHAAVIFNVCYSRSGINQKVVLNPNPPWAMSSSGLSPALENRGQCH